MEKVNEKLCVFEVDVFDYQSILVSLKDCSALFCCLDSPEGYDVSSLKKISFFYRNVLLKSDAH